MTDIVRDPAHSDGAPTIEGTGIRVWNVASAYEHSGYSPDEIVELYPALTLEDVHTALAYYYAHIEEFRERSDDTGAAEPPARGQFTPTRTSGYPSLKGFVAATGRLPPR